jgi:CRISPR-associated protein Cas5t
MKILKIRIYQPQAHYRIPFTFQRRHTYPLPPYSTVIGFLINALGIFNQEDDLYKNGVKNLKISIAGRFGSKITEYIWFRNLKKEKHTQRFGYVENREINGHIEHIGGQSPMQIDVLNDVHLAIYIAHKDEKYLEEIRENLSNPKNRLEVLHIGRAEDWIVLVEEPKFLDDSDIIYHRRDADYKHFFWIPDQFYIKNGNGWEIKENDKYEGLLYNLPTFVTIKNYETTFNRHGERNFEYVRTKLNDGLIKEEKLMLDISDKKNNLPIFLGELNGRS